jgi:hypothetical protein
MESKIEIKIAEQAVLVPITMTKWSNRASSKLAAEEVEISNDAREKSSRCSITLTRNDGVVGLQTLYGHINNNIIKKYCIPWATGTHLLPAELIDDFERDINNAIAEWNRLVEQVRLTYDESVETARKPKPDGLGKLFQEQWFPTVDEVVAKYSIEIKPYRMLSDPRHVDDIRVNLPQAKINKMKADIEQELVEVSKQTNIEVHKRITSALESLVDGLKRHGVKEGDDGKSGAFRDGTVTKMNELADIAKKLNVTGDAKLDAAVDAIKKDLTDLQPAELRDDQSKRKDIGSKAQKIIDDLDGAF